MKGRLLALALWGGSLFCLYVVCYSLSLPIAEYLGIQKPFYVFFAPVEWMRFRSDFVWNFTEDIYGRWGGRARVVERYPFHGTRRFLTYHNHGVKYWEQIYVDGKPVQQTWWDKNGHVLAEGFLRNGERWDGTFLNWDGGGLAAYRFWLRTYSNGAPGDTNAVDASLINIDRSMNPTEIRTWRLRARRDTLLLIAILAWPAYMIWRSITKKRTPVKRSTS